MLFEALGHFLYLQVHDLAQVFLVQRAEDDHRIHAVDELGAEDTLERVGELLAHVLICHLLFEVFIGLEIEADVTLAHDHIGAYVGGHDDQGVAEIHFAAAGVGEMAFFHDLQQHVVRFGVRLFHFVEDHDGIGAAADGFGKLAGVFVAYVSRRRADQAAHRVALHELRHIKLNQRFFAAKKETGQRFGEFGLAYAGGPQENEGADGALGILEAGAGAAHSFGNGFDGFVLPNDGLVHLFFHVQQALGFLLGDLHDGHSGPHGDQFSNVVHRNDGAVVAVPGGA